MSASLIAAKAAKLVPRALAGDPTAITLLAIAGIAAAVAAVNNK